MYLYVANLELILVNFLYTKITMNRVMTIFFQPVCSQNIVTIKWIDRQTGKQTEVEANKRKDEQTNRRTD